MCFVLVFCWLFFFFCRICLVLLPLKRKNSIQFLYARYHGVSIFKVINTELLSLEFVEQFSPLTVLLKILFRTVTLDHATDSAKVIGKETLNMFHTMKLNISDMRGVS